MDERQPEHLSDISTPSLLWQAQHGSEEEKAGARARLWELYRPPARRYLKRALGSADAADEVCQQFALRFLAAAIPRADPERGCFRHYLKKCLVNLVRDYRKRQQGRPRQLADDDPEPAVDPDAPSELDRELRQEIIHRTWPRLRAVQERTGQPFFDVLDYRANNRDATMEQIAEYVAARTGTPRTVDWAKKTLQRARDWFGDLLLDEVAAILENPNRESMEAELAGLDLLPFCERALRRRWKA